jgi:DNA-directed RNA polymerase subunit M/transcription elongation factor TFIIS
MTKKYKPVKTENPNFVCKKCGTNNLLFYNDDDTTYDGAYDIIRYQCDNCNYNWKVVLEYD